jgi:protein-tyrosine-phosphatase
MKLENQEVRMVRVLFVCTGNTCRSPLAEGLFRLLAGREGLDVEVRSAGVSAIDGIPVSGHSSRILGEVGATPPKASTALTGSLIEWADLIMTMTSAHKGLLLQRFPQAVDKVFTLKEYAEDDPGVLARIQEREALISELQLKQALGQQITDEELSKVAELERVIPNVDISDPYGGPLELYRSCASEIEAGLHKLVRKLKAEK